MAIRDFMTIKMIGTIRTVEDGGMIIKDSLQTNFVGDIIIIWIVIFSYKNNTISKILNPN